MPFLIIRPEYGGHPAEGTVVANAGPPPVLERLHYEFDWWLGDDLVGSHPFLLVTANLRHALETLGAPSGFAFDTVTVGASAFFKQTNPERALPPFAWLKVTGRAGIDDMAASPQNALVVSSRVLVVLLAHALEQAEIHQYRSHV
jgi:hypothetical protein